MKEYKNILLIILIIFLTAYFLNYIWESLHYPLYVCSWSQSSCAITASFIDAFIILGLYIGGAVLFKEKSWIFNLTKTRLIILATISFIIAYVIELRALYLQNWEYNAQMPLIPFLDVGLSPILQMMILPILTFFITKIIMSRINKGGIPQ